MGAVTYYRYASAHHIVHHTVALGPTASEMVPVRGGQTRRPGSLIVVDINYNATSGVYRDRGK